MLSLHSLFGPNPLQLVLNSDNANFKITYPQAEERALSAIGTFIIGHTFNASRIQVTQK